ncbi:hypothetical protein GCM10011609_88430 [Lentzea pudingi]|uniref:AMP-binding enzyme C-terminal domain-containing protein n=1 Tax=Lentzea pudingi TaxID=1789439 RepID=A0ABQ2IV02_9PSEU|nr:AMP-binding protein [Lentzea pudingi]GGN30563.1 hypothetical protein GCM10011609_88430 [Lentzea pudingi]
MDDFALRRGSRNNMLLVDIERHGSVDMLLDRTGRMAALTSPWTASAEPAPLCRRGVHPSPVRKGRAGNGQTARRARDLRHAFHYQLLTTAKDVPVLPSLRAAVSGGELMPTGVAETFRERFGVGLGESYGTTGTGVIAMDLSGALRPTVGKASPGIVLRVNEGELEVALPEGTPYLRRSDVDRYVDGWLRTHDRASQDEDGAVRLPGRSDSIVVIGGLKVDLVEVKSVLRQHPRITDVVVIHAESIEAYVSAEEDGPGAGELAGWCRDRLAAYKVPRLIRVLPALPRTPNGKLIRRTQILRGAVPRPS